MSAQLVGVGVGPGDPELLTLAAVTAIESADVVAYHARPGGSSTARSIAERFFRDGQIHELLHYPVTTGITDHPGGYAGAMAEFYVEAAARLSAHLDAGRTVAVLALTLACSSASYHLLEMPIRQGRIGNFLKPWRAIVAGATAMVIMALSSSFVGGTPLSRALHLRQGGGDLKRDVIMLVGDSVPLRMADPLAVAGQERGLTVVGTAQGMCTPMGAFLYFGPDDRFGKLCPPVKDVQDEVIATYSPGTILWWSRHEHIDRYEGDRVLSPESDEFWEVQRRALIATAERLTDRGETLVIVLTERPGIGVMSRPDDELASMLIKYTIEHDEYRQRFNQIVTEVAAQRDDIRTIDGDSLFCGDAPGVGLGPLCDDTVDGNVMRPDGNHVDNDLFGAQVAEQLLDKMRAVVS